MNAAARATACGPPAWPRGVAALLLLLAAASVGAAIPSFEEVRASHRPSDVTVTDRHGEPLQTLRNDLHGRRLRWVPLHELSPALRHAVVLSEDRRFWAHGGVDWAAVARSAFANVWNTRTQGASTLTMQLAGLLDETLARPAGGRSLRQKLGQVVVARELEARWHKSEILEAWMNLVPLRGEIVGIDALAQTLFGKHPHGLDAQESAIAAALVRAPNASVPRVGERACGVLQAMGRDCGGVAALAAQALARRGGMPLGPQIAPHLARQLVRDDSPPRLRSTLDARLQRAAVHALHAQLNELAPRQVQDGAVVVLDNASGEVRAWVGSAGDAASAPQVDGVLARRQPGSTLKPFVYGLALERRLLTAATLLDDSPAALPTGSGLYQPRNHDGGHHGPVSVRTALASSLNVPAVRVATMLPPDALFERLNALGLALPHTGGYHGLSLALGSADVTLLALANAYRALANGGRHGPVVLAAPARPGPRAPDPPPSLPPPLSLPAPDTTPAASVIDPAVAFVVADILADPVARAPTFGLDSVLATRGFAAVKTGTSKDMRDSWCVGFTDRYTVAVWIGNAGGAPMRDVSGVRGAAPVWRTLVEHLHARTPSRAPVAPAGVTMRRVGLAGRVEPSRGEWFLEGSVPSAPPQPALVRAIGIAHPVDGSVFALDPDVPAHAQRIPFEGDPGRWILDGRVVGEGASVHWTPQPGRYELRLLPHGARRAGDSGAGVAGHVVRFEVRGLVRATVD